MATTKLGVNCKAYRNTGTYGSPTWNEFTEFGDFSVSLDWDTQDVLRRGQRVKQKVKTLLSLEVKAKHLAIDKPASSDTTDYTALMDAMLSDTAVDVMILNGDIATSGVRGFRFDAQVSGASEDQGPGAVLMDDITLTPTPTGNDPKAVLIVSGTPQYKALTNDLSASFA